MMMMMILDGHLSAFKIRVLQDARHFLVDVMAVIFVYIS